MNRSKSVLHPKIFHAIGEKDGITVEVAMQWNDSYAEIGAVLHQQHSAARRRHAPDRACAQAMTRTLNNYIEKEEIAKKAKVETTGDDMREGLTCVLSVKVPEPKFSSQTKDKLVSSEVQPIVQEIVGASSPSSCSRTRTTPRSSAARSSTRRARAKRRARRAS